MKADHPLDWYVIVNPAAGSGAAKRRWPKIQQLLKTEGFRYFAVFTRTKGHAIQLVEEGVQKGYRYFMAVGGDGTNHEVANGLLQQKHVPCHELTYALLPVGTGNDWCRTYGIPRDLRRWLPMIRQLNTRLQDVGSIQYTLQGQQQQRYFVNVAGMAYDAYLVHYIDQNKSYVGGHLGYLFQLVKCIFRYSLSKAIVYFNGEEVEDEFYTINVGICRYSGGGMQLVPHAVPDDGLMALTLAGRLNILEVLLNTYRFYTGTLDKHKKIRTYQTQHIRVEAKANEATLVEADGEFLGETPVEFKIIEKALKVVVP